MSKENYEAPRKTSNIPRIALQEIHAKVLEYFNGDDEKAQVWFATHHPSLGQSPEAFVKAGNGESLMRWLDKELEEKK